MTSEYVLPARPWVRPARQGPDAGAVLDVLPPPGLSVGLK